MVSPEDIAERMAHLEPVAMRLEVKEGKNGCVLINDSYNSDFASLDIALDFILAVQKIKVVGVRLFYQIFWRVDNLVNCFIVR